MSKNILILHALPRRYHFRDLAQEYLKRGDRVFIFCADAEAHNYRKCFAAGATHIPHPGYPFTIPDLSEEERARFLAVARSCEAATGLGLGRIIAAGERDLSRAYTEREYAWAWEPLHRTLFNNPLLTEDIILATFDFWDKQIREHSFDLILGRGNNDVLSFPLLMLCTKLGIPFLNIRPSKVLSGRVFWTDDRLMDNALARESYARMTARGDTPSKEAIERLEAFRNAPRPAEYILYNWSLLSFKTAYLNSLKGVWRVVKEKLRFLRKGFSGPRPEPILPKFWYVNRVALFRRLHAKYYASFGDEELQSFQYAYMPLHKEPELMLNFRAPLWHTQRHTIKYIGTMLPAGFRLLAREHKGNGGRRFGRWLKSVTRYPRTSLIDPFGSQYPYIRNADLIVTDNGTGGWEGILLGKPVVTMETTFYDPVGLAVKCKDLNKLDATIFEALNTTVPEEERQRRICLFYDAEGKSSIEEKQAMDHPELSLQYIERLLERRQA